MVNVVVLQHTECETPGIITSTLLSRGVEVRYIRPFQGEIIPKTIDQAVGLIVMGGSMGVYEEERYPFLTLELRLIEKTLKEKKPVLGICLGSQLLATALGASVRKGKWKEIGWHQVELLAAAAEDRLLKNVPRSFVAFHWHGDIFDLPRDATSLASSLWTEHQAFRYGDNAYGFLFHMEITEEIIKAMINTFQGELREAKVDGKSIIQGIGKYLSYGQREIGEPVFDKWVSALQFQSS